LLTLYLADILRFATLRPVERATVALSEEGRCDRKKEQGQEP